MNMRSVHSLLLLAACHLLGARGLGVQAVSRTGAQLGTPKSASSAAATSKAAASASASTAEDESSWSPEFFAPQLTPRQFLIVSSPTLSKVVYTSLKNFKSTYGRTFVLIDSGLSEPAGIAVDHIRGLLYVADKGSEAVYRYTLRVNEVLDTKGNKQYSLSTDSTRISIIKGRTVQWVAVDPNGDLLFTTEDKQSVEKLEASTIEKISTGALDAGNLQVMTEKELEAMASAQLAAQLTPVSESGQSETDQDAIKSLYEAGTSPNAIAPGGVTSDGMRLYFSNLVEGQTYGSVVAGEASPRPSPGIASGSNPQPFPTLALSNASASSYGVVKTSNLIIWTSSGLAGGSVYGATQSGASSAQLASGLGDPRGICWDNDNTVFVADTSGGAVWSMPSGRLMDSVPVTKTVEFEGAFGVALLHESDPGWLVIGAEQGWSTGAIVTLVVLLFFLLLALLFAIQWSIRAMNAKRHALMPELPQAGGGEAGEEDED